MQIKAADDKQPDLDALALLLERPGVDAQTRRRIDTEMRRIRVGAAGERDAFYEIEFHSGRSCRAGHHPRPAARGGRAHRADRPPPRQPAPGHLGPGEQAFRRGCLDQRAGRVDRFLRWATVRDAVTDRAEPPARRGPGAAVRDRAGGAAEALRSRDDQAADPAARAHLQRRPHHQAQDEGGAGARRGPGHGHQGRSAGGPDDQPGPRHAQHRRDREGGEHGDGPADRAELAALHRPISVDWAARFGLPAVPVSPVAPALVTPARDAPRGCHSRREPAPRATDRFRRPSSTTVGPTPSRSAGGCSATSASATGAVERAWRQAMSGYTDAQVPLMALIHLRRVDVTDNS